MLEVEVVEIIVEVGVEVGGGEYIGLEVVEIEFNGIFEIGLVVDEKSTIGEIGVL